MVESGRSKGQRYFVFALMAAFLLVVGAPFSAWVGTEISAPWSNNTVLGPQSAVYEVFSNQSHQVAVASVSGGYQWSMPSGAKTSTVITNVTMGELAAHGVHQITVTTNSHLPGNVSLGFGFNPNSFLPYEEVQQKNITKVSLGVSPSFLTGNQSSPLVFQLQSNATGYILSFTAEGNTGLTEWFGPAAALDIGYIVLGAIALIFVVLAMPWLDIDIGRIRKGTVRITKGATSRITRRKSRARRSPR